MAVISAPTVTLPYLKLPPGKALGLSGKDLVLVDVKQPILESLPVTNPIAPAPETEPDALLRAATLAVTASLKQDKNIGASSPGKISELIESTILPLFDFRHMTQLAVARNWRLARTTERAYRRVQDTAGAHLLHSAGELPRSGD